MKQRCDRQLKASVQARCLWNPPLPLFFQIAHISPDPCRSLLGIWLGISWPISHLWSLYPPIHMEMVARWTASPVTSIFWRLHRCLVLKVHLHLSLFTHSVVSDSLQPHGLQHTGLSCPSSSPGACSNPCPLSQWYHPTISSSVAPFISCLQFFPASGSFQMSQIFASGGQSTGASASASVLPMSIQDWFPLGLTGLISLLSKEISSLLQHQQFKRIKFSLLNPFFVQLSLPYITTGKTIALTIWTFVSKVMSLLFNILSRFVIAFLPRSKCLLISWLQSLSTVIHKTLHHLATHRHF